MNSQEEQDRHWMRRAIELAHMCPPAEGAYSVGAIIVDAQGVEIANGYSRETDPKVHAEESALAKLPPGDPRFSGSTIYSTLEPCSQRASRPNPCTQLILNSGICRVVIAWREPSLFIENCVGIELLEQNGVETLEFSDMADAAMVPNSHLNLNG
jgi:diaminohydroxyphosphoribosylaminopyrimidine deaminase / 5-amino-6-(5-phosphoribosylamino)uracil reductase